MSKLSSCLEAADISVLLLVFPQLQAGLTLERFQAVRSRERGRKDPGGGISPMLRNQPSLSPIKAQDHITHPAEREGEGSRRFSQLHCWTGPQKSGFSPSLDLGFPGCCLGFYPDQIKPFHWFGHAVSSSASTPKLPRNAVPSSRASVSPCRFKS